ncbi:related to membrane protein [Cephalotrichum gorgonifer]|uniref:Related to membrane protein n=1 Tax=Cephalotrichum gorgonifer TaxID=2041049 RepID=A0AAE8N607_9PEZI|nr:related to membrane protein [Cephalotrichum gorgonifer]
MDNPVVANILGTAGAVCWSIQLIPQIIKNYRRHSTEGLHHAMYFSWAIAGIPLGVYNLVQDFNIALQIQPHILIFLSLVAWAQCQYYGAKWRPAFVLGASAAAAVCIGGVECGLYFALKEAVRKDQEWPLILMVVLAALFLAIGVLRYYWEIYKSRSVEGISFMFVVIDATGDLVSILALLFEESIDVLGVVVYSVELGLWIGILALGAYYRLWVWLSSRLGSRKDDAVGGDALNGTSAEGIQDTVRETKQP